jgi:hypothetical protein
MVALTLLLGKHRWEDALLLKGCAEIDVLRESTRFDDARQGGASLDGFIRQAQGRVRAPDAPRTPVDQPLAVNCAQLNQPQGHDQSLPVNDMARILI